ncbi:MAG: aldehyde dehydrogenase family protein, partial [Sphingobacterium sp.]
MKLEMYINGEWTQGTSGKFSNVINPATEQMLGSLPLASADDLDHALKAVETGFANWSRTSAYDRSVIMRKAALLVRERVANIARLMTLEQGKPLTESTAEAASAADHIEWYAEEGRRAYGRLIPPRSPN